MVSHHKCNNVESLVNISRHKSDNFLYQKKKTTGMLRYCNMSEVYTTMKQTMTKANATCQTFGHIEASNQLCVPLISSMKHLSRITSPTYICGFSERGLSLLTVQLPTAIAFMVVESEGVFREY